MVLEDGGLESLQHIRLKTQPPGAQTATTTRRHATQKIRRPRNHTWWRGAIIRWTAVGQCQANRHASMCVCVRVCVRARACVSCVRRGHEPAVGARRVTWQPAPRRPSCDRLSLQAKLSTADCHSCICATPAPPRGTTAATKKLPAEIFINKCISGFILEE